MSKRPGRRADKTQRPTRKISDREYQRRKRAKRKRAVRDNQSNVDRVIAMMCTRAFESRTNADALKLAAELTLAQIEDQIRGPRANDFDSHHVNELSDRLGALTYYAFLAHKDMQSGKRSKRGKR